ncbi:hypothetical protein DAEQUDRAFT_769140 [Daedalea quercina L-15889]|uniref:F-box domain-containing protein n=1 Tax=Daedalea quercina L-15889 TaxID=1314783 RepID=A0A165M0T8_9APHY|nr:hypothetical protein DAEQUDRAFT_769140 [Daedalea quercina L-15889]
MPSPVLALRVDIPAEVVHEIFEQLSPHVRTDEGCLPVNDEEKAARRALSRCARACRAFYRPALKVLWREQELAQACRVLPSFTVQLVNPEPRNGHGSDGDNNEDWLPEETFEPSVDPQVYSYSYLPGPISSEEWSRFAYHAQFIRVLRHEHGYGESFDPSVFFFLHQHARGMPLFPNLRELIWHYATSEVISVISPTIRILRFPGDLREEHIGRTDLTYCMRRDTFKMLLPSVLCITPALRELEIQTLGHEQLWYQFVPPPTRSFVGRNIHTMRISESLGVLLRGALPALSAIPALAVLEINDSEPRDDDTLHAFGPQIWDKPTTWSYNRLRRLRIDTYMAAVMAIIVDAIFAPELEDLELVHKGYENSDHIPEPLRTIWTTLCSRNVTSLLRAHIDLRECDLPWDYEDYEDEDTETEAVPPFLALTRPLLQLCQLRELDLYTGRRELLTDTSLLTMLAAWPMIEKLAISVAVLPLSSLQAIVQASPRLKSLTIKRFPPIVPLADYGFKSRCATSEDAATGHALQELCFYSPPNILDPANVVRIANFLDKLFPRLHAQRCVGKGTRFIQQQSWINILDEIVKIQLARHGH